MNNRWNQKLTDFYNRIEKGNMREEEIAIEYAKLWWDDTDFFRHSPAFSHPNNAGFVDNIDVNQRKNMALVNTFGEGVNLCKRAMLISDTSVLWETNSRLNKYLLHSYKDTTPSNISAQTSIDYEAYLQINDVEVLGRFLKENKRMVLSEYSIYIPDIMVNVYEDSYWSGNSYYTENPSQNMINKLLEMKSRASCSIASPFIEDKYLRAVAQIDIPYIDSKSNDAIVKIIEDYEEEFSRFRLYLNEKFLELDEVNGSDSFDTSLKRIGLDIQKGTNALASDIKRMKRNALIRMGSHVAIGVVAATLVAINGTVFNQLALEKLLAYLGAGGGIISMVSFAEDYLNKRQDVREQPFYFVWLFHKK